MPEPLLMTHAAIELEGAPNFRDLGGLRTDDGREVRRGLVFRSGHFVDLTDHDLGMFENLGIETVVDFRGEYERSIFGRDRLPRGVSVVSIPILAAGMDVAVHAAILRGDFAVLPDLAMASRSFINENTDALSDLLRLLADPINLPLAFHCIGGKDRTGVAAAVILALLGVPWPVIRADYLETNNRHRIPVEDRVARLAHQAKAPQPADRTALDAARRFFLVRPEYIDAARDEIMRRAGSIERYALDDLRLDEGVLERLRHNLLTTDQ